MSDREVITLANEFKEPGNYTVLFDGTDLASGIYVYKLETGGNFKSLKMVLIK